MGKNTGVGRGGKRPGAGRKSAEETGIIPMEKHTLTMTAEGAALLRELGGGYLSRGLREALRRLHATAGR
jgi:hypothetical protein